MKRIVFGALAIGLLVMLAGISYQRIASLNKEVSAMVEQRYPKTVAANQVKADVNEATRSMLSVLVMTDPDQEDVRVVDCTVCGGDGWFMEGPDERPPQRCFRCDGTGRHEMLFEPIEMDDLCIPEGVEP